MMRKIYTTVDKDLLMKIVWDDLIEAKFFEEWVFSYKLADLKWISNATDDIVVKPDEWIDIWITSVKWFERQDVDKIVNQAKKLEKEWKYQEAQKLFDESIEEWKNVLKNAFWDKTLRLWNWIWRREWKSEPTIIFWLKNITENDIDILVDISQNKFKQKSFFTAEDSGIEKFWIINEKSDYL